MIMTKKENENANQLNFSRKQSLMRWLYPFQLEMKTHFHFAISIQDKSIAISSRNQMYSRTGPRTGHIRTGTHPHTSTCPHEMGTAARIVEAKKKKKKKMPLVKTSKNWFLLIWCLVSGPDTLPSHHVRQLAAQRQFDKSSRLEWFKNNLAEISKWLARKHTHTHARARHRIMSTSTPPRQGGHGVVGTLEPL